MTLDLDAASRMLAPTGIVPHSLERLTSGKANTNYRVETDRGTLLLRIYQREPQAARLEEIVLGTLPNGFPTAWIVAQGKGFVLLDFCPGTDLEQLLELQTPIPTKIVAGQLARARLQLNDLRCVASGFFSGLDAVPLGTRSEDLPVAEPWPSAAEGLLGWLRHLLPKVRLAPSLKARLAKVVDDAEPRLQAIAGPPVLVHGDFKPSNLLVNEAGLTAVIDWEFAHAGTWLSDIGQLLRHPETLPLRFIDAFLDELNAPEDTMVLSRTLDLVNLVDFLHKEVDQPTMRHNVERRIQEVCDLYEARFGRLP